jgi:hypothetical protein
MPTKAVKLAKQATTIAFHLWHETRFRVAPLNEKHFRAKRFPRDIKANRNTEWGAVLCP